MPYVTQSFYTDTYKGTLVPSSLFNTYALKASYTVKKLTLAKSDSYTTANEIKLATCSLMDFYYREDNNILEQTSERVGDYSVNYKTYSQNQTRENKEYQIAFNYLGHTGLMSGAGIEIGCECYEDE